MIFKVQRPLSSSAQDMRFLVYNEDRSIVRMLSASDELERVLAGANKAYAHAVFNPTTKTFTWGELAPQQDW